jgi:nicotinic acid phosphoribosyltransferase
MEFGTRRAQEIDAAVWGARAAYIHVVYQIPLTYLVVQLDEFY